jgi:hypothetical protein
LQICPRTITDDAKFKYFVAPALLRAGTNIATQRQEKADGQQNFQAIVILLWKKEKKMLRNEQTICKNKAKLNQIYYKVSRP